MPDERKKFNLLNDRGEVAASFTKLRTDQDSLVMSSTSTRLWRIPVSELDRFLTWFTEGD